MPANPDLGSTTNEPLTLDQFSQINLGKESLPSPELLQKLVEFDQKCFSSPDQTTSPEYGPPPMTAAEIVKSLEGGASMLVLHDEKQNLVAVAQYFFKRKRGKEAELHIMSLAVDSKFRKRGLGRLLMKKMYEVAQKDDVDLITLRVDPLNHPAVKAYLREGFVYVGIRTKPVGDHEDVRTLAASKRISKSASFEQPADLSSQQEVDKVIAVVEIDDLEKITAFTKDGFVGARLTLNGLLVMRKLTDESSLSFRPWA